MSRAIQLSKSPARFFEVEHLFKPQGFASETDRDSPRDRVAGIMGPSLVFSFSSIFPVSGGYNLHFTLHQAFPDPLNGKVQLLCFPKWLVLPTLIQSPSITRFLPHLQIASPARVKPILLAPNHHVRIQVQQGRRDHRLAPQGGPHQAHPGRPALRAWRARLDGNGIADLIACMQFYKYFKQGE